MHKREGSRCRVALLGVSERSHRLIGNAFAANDASPYVLSTVEDAEVAVVDIDGNAGIKLWKSFRRHHPSRPAVLLSALPTPPCSNALVLKKPVTIDEVLDALHDVRHQVSARRLEHAPVPPAAECADAEVLPRPSFAAGKPQPDLPASLVADAGAEPVETIARSRPRPRAAPQPAADELATVCGDHEDIDANSAVSVALRSYHPIGTLQQLLTTAISAVGADGHARCLDGPLFRGRPIVLEQDRGVRVLVDLPVVSLRQLCILPTAESGTILREARPEDRREEARVMVANDFLWNIAIMTARGRIPAGVDPTAPVKLAHWPQFTRLVSIPHAARIAELWAGSSASAIEIARALEIPQRYVFGFFSAAIATGLLDAPLQSTARRSPRRARAKGDRGWIAATLLGLSARRDSLTAGTAAAASLARSTIARALQAPDPIALAGSPADGSVAAPSPGLLGRLLGRRAP